jgi:predicted murein hydrolase (TIGR00659 family)
MSAGPSSIRADLSASPLLWLTVTLLAYQAAWAIYRRSRQHPVANPVLISVTLVIGLLLITGTRYETYLDGARLVHVLTGPATVALAIPLHAGVARLRAMLVPITVAVLVGSVTAIGSAVAIGWLFGASADTLLSLAPRSATMPVAIGVSERVGGLGPLTALAVTVTGISGAIMARGLLDRLRVEDPAVRGFAVGLAAHAIGTASAVQLGEGALAFAALAMGLNGIVTALLLPLLLRLLAPGG